MSRSSLVFTAGALALSVLFGPFLDDRVEAGQTGASPTIAVVPFDNLSGQDADA